MIDVMPSFTLDRRRDKGPSQGLFSRTTSASTHGNNGTCNPKAEKGNWYAEQPFLLLLSFTLGGISQKRVAVGVSALLLSF